MRKAAFSLMMAALAVAVAVPALAEEGEWIELFNGKDLQGWTPKIRGYELGENFANTFRVEEGAITVGYEGYDTFDERFGHIFYETPFSHYRLKVEYRFFGEQVEGGPGWAFRNSGVMLHCQPPETMTKDQDFPVSIELQLLGGNGTEDRTTCNLCTPGTHVVMDDKLQRRHCINSTSKTYHGDDWVTIEVEVHGDGTIRHIIDGEPVLVYEQPQLDTRDKNVKGTELVKDEDDLLISSGYISLQSESHPVAFRKVSLLPLKE
jgi:hypothetical protein